VLTTQRIKQNDIFAHGAYRVEFTHSNSVGDSCCSRVLTTFVPPPTVDSATAGCHTLSRMRGAMGSISSMRNGTTIACNRASIRAWRYDFFCKVSMVSPAARCCALTPSRHPAHQRPVCAVCSALPMSADNSIAPVHRSWSVHVKTVHSILMCWSLHRFRSCNLQLIDSAPLGQYTC
jgi:hypothetical protein